MEKLQNKTHLLLEAQLRTDALEQENCWSNWNLAVEAKEQSSAVGECHAVYRVAFLTLTFGPRLEDDF